MKNIKTFELFVVKSFENLYSNDRNGLMMSIIKNDNNEFKYELDLAVKKMELEKQDKDGNTALLLASREGRLKMIKELIKVGANLYHKNHKNEDFYDLAVNRFKFVNFVKDWIEETYPEFIMAKKYNL